MQFDKVKSRIKPFIPAVSAAAVFAVLFFVNVAPAQLDDNNVVIGGAANVRFTLTAKPLPKSPAPKPSAAAPKPAETKVDIEGTDSVVVKADPTAAKPETEVTIEGSAGVVVKAETPAPAATATAIPPAATATALPPATSAVEPELKPTEKIKNDFIFFEINPGPGETGRFSIETIGGDPTVDSDNNKILIYGRPRPWTSFTTFKIDGEDYVFGGQTKKRAGRGAKYGEVIESAKALEGGSAITKCRIAGLDVTQRLDITGGPVSGMLDTIRITYVVSNPTDQPKEVSARVVLDTLLGSNDGAPFRVGLRDVTMETKLAGGQIPEFWVAFDSLENPGVVARGTLRGENLTAPDEVLFSNWGKLADNPFDVPHEPGKSFLREGEEEMDSATALFWRNRTVRPGGEVRFVTMYGIDYLNVVGDVLNIGSTPYLGKWRTGRNQIRPYTLYVFVGNNAGFDLTKVKVRLNLPKGIELAPGEDMEKSFDTLKPGDERTVGWLIQPAPFSDGDRKITISASSAEVEKVEMTTRVTLLSPPGVDAKIEAPDALTLVNGKEYGPANPFEVRLSCRNKGESPIDNLRVELALPAGLSFPAIIDAAQTFPRLEGRETIVFTWKVIANGEGGGKLPINVTITSDSTEKAAAGKTITVPPMPTKIEWAGVPRAAGLKVIFPAELFMNAVHDMKGAEFAVQFNPDVLTAIRVSQGTAFVESGAASQWREPEIDNRRGLVTGFAASRTDSPFNGNGSLAVIHFATKAPGLSEIKLIDLRLISSKDKTIEAVVEDAAIEVNE